MAADFWAAAEDRFQDSEILYGKGRWTGAVYRARFGLECFLKARLLRALGTDQLPSKWHTHNLWELFKGTHKRAVPRTVATTLAEINAVDVTIRYNAEVFDEETASRLLAKIRGIQRWLARP